MEKIDYNNIPEALQFIIDRLDVVENTFLGARDHNEAEEPFTYDEAAEFLRLKDVGTIRRYVREGILVCRKLDPNSGKLYIFKSDIIALLKIGRVKSIRDYGDEADEFLRINPIV
jgi:hypothetical protein